MGEKIQFTEAEVMAAIDAGAICPAGVVIHFTGNKFALAAEYSAAEDVMVALAQAGRIRLAGTWWREDER